jgi:hypothetical protein
MLLKLAQCCSSIYSFREQEKYLIKVNLRCGGRDWRTARIERRRIRPPLIHAIGVIRGRFFVSVSVWKKGEPRIQRIRRSEQKGAARASPATQELLTAEGAEGR